MLVLVKGWIQHSYINPDKNVIRKLANYLTTLSSGLPPGFRLTEEILNAEKPTLPPPASIHYNEKHVG